MPTSLRGQLSDCFERAALRYVSNVVDNNTNVTGARVGSCFANITAHAVCTIEVHPTTAQPPLMQITMLLLLLLLLLLLPQLLLLPPGQPG
jgi:hypothetical protein